LNAIPLKVTEQYYDDPRHFYVTVEKQFSLYYETMYKLKREYKGKDPLKFFIPGDGVGIGSIISMMLGVEYYSTEPNGIGSVARSLGIISSDEFFFGR